MVACVVQHSKQVRGVLVQRRSMALTLHREQVTIQRVMWGGSDGWRTGTGILTRLTSDAITNQSAAAVPVLCAVCCCGSERKRSDEESWS